MLPAVFQYLIHQVINTLNPVEGLGFVSVYIDDLFLYSKILKEHLGHLSKVMDRSTSTKFLGHGLNPQGFAKP